MQYCVERMDFETALAGERPRLVRLCAWFTGHEEAAEDLAQDTLVAAWKSRGKLTSLDKLKPWMSAIARNVCLDWSRGQYREQEYVSHSIETSETPWDEEPVDETDLERELDRQELARLLDRALSLLPPETGQMLVEYYIKESSHAEIAAMMKLKPGTVAVRLQRGKLALLRYLRTNLRDESLAFGLIREQGAAWEETNIWCLSCGQVRLLGRFEKNELFALRCPRCSPEPGTIMAGMDLTQPFYTNLLGDIKTYKPAYSRMLTGLAPLYRQALQFRTTACPSCGQLVKVVIEDWRKTHGGPHEARQIRLHCPACDWASNKTLSGLVMARPEAQRFWRAYPRLRILPDQEIEVQGSPAFLTRIQSVTGSAELHVISKRDTLEFMEAHTNANL